MALRGEPLLLLYCSESAPPEGVYCAPTAMNPSAKFWTAVVRDPNVDEELA